MKFAKILLAVSMFAGSSAFAAHAPPAGSSNSTCQHSNKTDNWNASKGGGYLKTVFSAPAPAEKTYQQNPSNAQREGKAG